MDAANNANAGVQTGNAANKQQFFGGLTTAIGGMLSDERAKVDVRPTSNARLLAMALEPEANREALAPVRGSVYRYKPAIAEALGTDTDPRPGVMAQDLERSPAGADVVFDADGGTKGIDRDRALGFTLAAAAGLDKRLRRVEQRKAA